MAKYCVIRTDLMSGTKQPADLLSVRVYDGEGNMIDAENGLIVKVGALEDGEREVHKATLYADRDNLDECAILAGVEMMYDATKHSLDDYINVAGKAVRAYIPRNRNVFSVTKEGFLDGTVPAVGDTVGIGANGKLEASGTNLGKCIAIEKAGMFTFYVIQIDKNVA
jgi:hypothetical protein